MIRVASESDLPAIVEIYNQAVEQRFATADLRPVTIDQRRAWFVAHESSMYPIHVYEQDQEVVGWCSFSSYRSGREAVLGRGAQGRGVGSALVQHAVREAPRLGKRVLFGILLERNHASIRLMEKCGFELWGKLPDVAMIDGELLSHLYYGRKV